VTRRDTGGGHERPTFKGLRARSDALQIRLALLGLLAMLDWALAFWAIQSEVRLSFPALVVLFCFIWIVATVTCFRLFQVRARMRTLQKEHASKH
jgi:hypothetical protein